MRKLLKSIPISLFIGMLSIVSIYAARYVVLDNDCLSSAPGVVYNNGFTYGKGSNDYNGDYRIAKAGASASYQWEYNLKYSQTGQCDYRVYLFNYKFNCKRATYWLKNNYNSYAVYLNQDTAPGGWTKIKSNLAGTGEYYLGGSLSAAQSSLGGYVGADAMEVIYAN